MKSEDAMVVWTPNREPFSIDATRGRVVATTIPEHPKTQRYSHSVGACDHGWREKSEAERQEALHQLANQMINEDKIAPADLDKAFSQIEGWSGV
jgi:hypothetical protein